MEINKKKYRIVEKIYGDGHKEYKAQEVFLNFYLFKIWKDYVLEVWDYGYGSIRFICCGHTYEDCKQQLLENIESKHNGYLKKKLINKINHKL